MEKIIPINEIVGSILSYDVDDVATLQADPKSFIYSHYDIEVPTNVEIVMNTDSKVNLALPYYECVEEAFAKAMGDKELSEVAGGDFLVFPFVTLIIAGAVATAGVAAAGGGAAWAAKASNK